MNTESIPSTEAPEAGADTGRSSSITRMALSGVALSLALFAGACGSDDEKAQDTTEESTDTSMAADDMADDTADDMADDTADAATNTLVDVASGNPDFSTLVAAVTAADLGETLSGSDEYTVFAPTNAAFEKALTALGITADELLADKEKLTSILTYHVVPGKVMAADVVGMNGKKVATANGAELTVTVAGDTVKVDDATVTQTDIEADNGVIHVIDSVLLPPQG